jgi:hypothetical protein
MEKRSKQNHPGSHRMNSWAAQSVTHSFIYSDTDSETVMYYMFSNKRHNIKTYKK